MTVRGWRPVETKGLEYFIAVYDCGSIMTAAEKPGIPEAPSVALSVGYLLVLGEGLWSSLGRRAGGVRARCGGQRSDSATGFGDCVAD